MKKIRNNLFYLMPEEQLRKTFSTFKGIGNANTEFEALRIDQVTPETCQNLMGTEAPPKPTSPVACESSPAKKQLQKHLEPC